jgi:metal-dependent HD superfamily phosphatase/phosphodiesterase
MREKIKAAIQGAHKSLINGIDSEVATDKVESLFKEEIRDIVEKYKLLLENPEINAYWAIWHMNEVLKDKYNL